MSAFPLLPDGESPRIVSLIASATEIVFELGLGPFLVGRSHECDYPLSVAELPCCTRPRFDCSGTSREIDQLVKCSLHDALSIYEVFDDVLLRLQPTHIITQTQCEVCAVSLRDVERSVAMRLKSCPQIIALAPNSLADIWDDFRRVADGVGANAEPVIVRLQSQMADLRVQPEAKPRVACIEWLEPLMAAGNWVPELVQLAGGENLFGTAGAHSPWMTWEELLAADPDIIIAMPCGFSVERTLPEMHWLTERPEYPQLHAARTGQVYVADGNQYFNRPGPRVVESLRILVDIFAGATSEDSNAFVRMPVLS
jgi:iron complex transport system substrate-binding protein